MPMHQILVIGAGSIGERHIRCFQQTGRADVSVCEIDSALRNRIATDYDLRHTFEDLAKALSAKPDGVVVATPAHLHVPMALQAAQAGCHLLIEKPLSTNLIGVGELAQCVSESQRVAQVGYVMRHYPLVAKVKNGLGQGRWGKPLQLTIVSGQHFPLYRPAYREIYYARHDTGGGAIQDGLTHFLDTAHWWLGPIDRLTGDMAHLALDGVEVEDTVNVLARHGEIMGAYHFNQHQHSNETTFTLVCESATVRLDFCTNRLRVMKQPDGEWIDESNDELQRNEAFTNQANAFLDALEGRPSASCTLDEARHTLDCQLALLEETKRTSRWREINHCST